LNQSAMVAVPCLMTVAAGVFAPGHLGELTRYLPFELVDDVLEMTGAVQKRMRALPSRVGMYFVLAMTLFPGIGYLKVWDKMTGALEDLGLPRPSEKALRDLRRQCRVVKPCCLEVNNVAAISGLRSGAVGGGAGRSGRTG
jgi:Insertion element 4 transposase N-terminal